MPQAQGQITAAQADGGTRSVRASLLRALAALGITLHFLMILTVITHTDERIAQSSSWQPALALINLYSTTTFANRNFGFFAPGVTPDWNIHMTTIAESGERREYALPLPGREMDVKMYSMLGHFSENEDTMDLFARSWAVYAMNDDAEVIKVEIEVTRNYIPSMREYRAGKRIHEEGFYRTTFEFH